MRKHSPSIYPLIILAGLICLAASDSGDVHVDKGIASFENGDFAGAVAELEAAVAKNLSRYQPPVVYTILGNAFVELGRYDQAISAHKKALELDPAFYVAWVNLGIAYRLKGDLDQAENCYNEALRLQPEYAELHASLGTLYIIRRRPEEAVAALETAVKLNPNLAVAHANMALALALTGRYDLSEQALSRAVRLGYKNADVIQKRIQTLKSGK